MNRTQELQMKIQMLVDKYVDEVGYSPIINTTGYAVFVVKGDKVQR